MIFLILHLIKKVSTCAHEYYSCLCSLRAVYTNICIYTYVHIDYHSVMYVQ